MEKKNERKNLIMIYDLEDPLDLVLSYFEPINWSVGEMESRHSVKVVSGDRYPYRPQAKER